MRAFEGVSYLSSCRALSAFWSDTTAFPHHSSHHEPSSPTVPSQPQENLLKLWVHINPDIVHIWCFGYRDKAVTNPSCSYKIPNSLPCRVPPLNASFKVLATGRPSLSGLPRPALPYSDNKSVLLRIVSHIKRHDRLGRVPTVHQLTRCLH